MSLLQLPAEILMQILDCQWFIFARTGWFRNLHLSQKTLRRLLSSQDVEKSLLQVKDNLEILDLELKGFEDWGSVLERLLVRDSLPHLQFGFGRPDEQGLTPESYWDAFHASSMWNGDLHRQSPAASSERHPLLPDLPRRNYLSLSTIRAVLSVENLTVLELDLCGTRLVPLQEGDFHICTSIGALLTTLRRLRLRMRSICADALRPHHNNTVLRLSEVLINLSLSNESNPTSIAAAHSIPCGSIGGDFFQLKADIEDQAKALAARMASPKTIRILTQTFPYIDMRSLDVLTGKSMILADDMAWEDDGKTIEVD
ncbi:hypothetical protein F4818DRAFT_439889 [Hypoxylon cercidicola]|nr:hypothetical protein F4818DRAFT_439889 [Hypoxylon cercidicola]